MDEALARKIAVEQELIEAKKAFDVLVAAFVMSMDHYVRIRSAITMTDPDQSDPWVPVVGDMHLGYPIVVVDGTDIKPHLELVGKDLRPAYYAGVTSFGIERRDMKEPEFEAAAAPGLDPGHEEEGEDDEGDTYLTDAP